MKILTLAIPESNVGYSILQETAKRANLEVVNVASKEDVWQGFETKMKLYAQACALYKDEDLLIIIDAFDVLIHPQAAQKLLILQKWFQSKTDTHILVSRETCCSDQNCIIVRPFLHTLPEYRKHQGRMYVNSGVIAGRPAALLDMWTFMQKTGMYDDQLGLAMYMNLRQHPFVDMDENARLLSKTIVMYDNLVPYKTAAIHAPFVHVPGLASTGASIAYRSLSMEWAGQTLPLTRLAKRNLLLVICIILLVATASYTFNLVDEALVALAVSLFWIAWIYITKGDMI